MSSDNLDLSHLSQMPIQSRIELLRKFFNFDEYAFAEILDIDVVQTNNIPKEESIKAIDAMVKIATNLNEIFKPEDIKVWMAKPNPALQGICPNDYVKKPGGIFEIANLLETL
ncbi:DUF2384 domain-containing protein [bacterium]|nr:DUF2384 domain-containing protein [bacterium]